MSVNTNKVNRTRFAGVRTMSKTSESVTETVTVNRTAPIIDSDRKGESRPLLSKLVGGASAAYSLRDLNDKSGSNKVVRVRRDSDGNERDFLAKEVSNGTMEVWVGVGNNGYVAKWYDQSGNDKDAEQTDPNKQPLITNGVNHDTDGNLIKDKPSLLFNASNLRVDNNITGQHFNAFAVVKPSREDPLTDGYIFDNFTTYGRGLLHDDYWSGRFTLLTDATSTSPIRRRVKVDVVNTTNQPALQLITSIIINTSATSLEGNAFIYNANTGVGSSINTTGSDAIPFQENKRAQYIGAGGASSKYFSGYISELIIYTGSDQRDNRIAIEANISNQYKIETYPY